MKTTRLPLLPGIVIVGVTLGLAGCAAPGSSSNTGPQSSTAAAGAPGASLPTAPGSVTIGGADFPESDILAHVYADAMQAKGVSVTVNDNVGERPAYLAALKDGSIGAVPEYTGSILDYLDHSATQKTPAAVDTALKKAAADNGYAIGNFAQAEDADTITVTRATADKYYLKSIADLKHVASKLTLGAPAPFETVPYGVPALASTYAVKFKQFVPLQASGTITQTALKDGTVDAADIFSTDPSIKKDGFVTLSDPKSIFAAQNVVPMFRQGTLTQPMLNACNAVSAKLTTADLRDLVSQVADGSDPATVAAAWTHRNHLG
jgi:osmoprotectant transport system substrate-binding protein